MSTFRDSLDDLEDFASIYEDLELDELVKEENFVLSRENENDEE